MSSYQDYLPSCETRRTTPRMKRSVSCIDLASNQYSVKRRRTSFAPVDIHTEHASQVASSSSSLLVRQPSSDRYIAARPKTSIPLHSSPRTNRIAKLFDLVDDRVLNYADTPPKSEPPEMVSMLRRSVSDLFKTPPVERPTSVTSNLGSRKQFILALDGPNIPDDPFAYPISWSKKNRIAVACGPDVYYQDLDTRQIAKLANVKRADGNIHAIEWGDAKNAEILALGTTKGSLQLFDSVTHSPTRCWESPDQLAVGALSWAGDVLAVARNGGVISLFDIRVRHLEVSRHQGHKGRVLGVKWSSTHSYLASGDEFGVVNVWDVRAAKALAFGGARGSKMRHLGPVKALAWCEWKPDLLATGTTYPEGKIRVYSTSSLTSLPEPIHSVALNTSVMSLHWSTHCKELLSTHGSTFAPVSNPDPSHGVRGGNVFKSIPSPIMNTITVHSYPKMNRLVSVPAHAGAVAHSCIGPTGTMVFTVCPREEAMKQWQVWSKPKPEPKPDSVYDKCIIR